uniref:Uncharacterized protein n=1 Tax=uncultured prokaryote TaxID=198431 RepID=H5S959_9ZZZZ|nr:hypothetical protein HGMM_F03A04C18 [uncultured prokaryote]
MDVRVQDHPDHTEELGLGSAPLAHLVQLSDDHPLDLCGIEMAGALPDALQQLLQACLGCFLR